MENNILDKFKDLSFDKKSHSKLKETKFVIKDEEIIQNDTSLIFNPPKTLSFLQED